MTAARVNAIRGGQALIEFRGFSPQDRETLQKALGDKLTVQESPWTGLLNAWDFGSKHRDHFRSFGSGRREA